MAASGKKASTGSGDSSSSEDEDLEKFKEAVWNVDGPKNTGKKHQEPKPTRRLIVSDHQHDCNELQVTPEFRAHVAKKLEHMLDGFISEKPAGAVSHQSSSTLEDDDLGFKLFATSNQGQRFDEPQCPVKRRRVPSSSESDGEMDMRIREAVVSADEVLRPPVWEVTTKKVDVEDPSGQSKEDKTECPLPKKKKKKKKKKKATECEDESVGTVFKDQKCQAGESPTLKKGKKRDRLKTKSAKSIPDKSSLQPGKDGRETAEKQEQEGSAQAKVKRKRRRKRKAVDESTEV
ncbi:unnamed protein product [Boreogadus saida]